MQCHFQEHMTNFDWLPGMAGHCSPHLAEFYTHRKLTVCVCVCVCLHFIIIIIITIIIIYQFWGFKVCISHVSDQLWDQPNPYLLGTRSVKLITRLNLEPRLRRHGHITLLCHTSSWFGASSYKLHGVTYGPSESLKGKICKSMVRCFII